MFGSNKHNIFVLKKRLEKLKSQYKNVYDSIDPEAKMHFKNFRKHFMLFSLSKRIYNLEKIIEKRISFNEKKENK